MFEIDMQISKPPQDVFDLLARVELAPRWYSAVEDVNALSRGETGLGSHFRFTRQLGGAQIENDVEVTAFEPGHAIELSSINGPTPFRYRYEVAPSGKGTTLHMTGQISGEGLPAPMAVLGPLAERFFKKGMNDNLEAFRAMVEHAG